jgi:hypothetical protein
MKLLSKVNKRNTLLLGALTCLMLAGSVSAFAARQTFSGKAVAAVTVVTESQDSFFSSTTYQDLPGATVTINVPAGKIQLVQAAYFAESHCGSTFHDHWCSVRILADGTEMSPSAFESSIDFAFDGSGTGDDFREGHAMQRSILLGPGTHTIRVQVAVSASDDGLFLDDWSLTITQYNNGK